MSNGTTHLARPVYVVDGARTPFLKAKGKTGPFPAADLAVQSGRALLSRLPFAPSEIDEVIMGCVMPGPNEANIARVIGLRLGCGIDTPAWTVQRNCASGMQALDCAASNIANGRAELVLTGGVEAMSYAPLLLNETMVNWMADLYAAKKTLDKAKVLTKLRPGHLKPIIGLVCGLTDPMNGLGMGQTAEIIAHRFGISRQTMDEYAARSHHRLAHAQEQGWMDEITPIYDNRGNVYQADDGVRADSSVEKLAKLKPVFDRHFGKVTAANSAQITDGATLLVLASAEAVEKHNLPVLGRIVDSHWAALEPAEMGLGPVHAMSPIMQRHQLSVDDVDYWEINEAFAAQVLACVAAWQDDDYCQQFLGLPAALGAIDETRLNVDGGGVSLGHPVGASGARIVLHLLQVLKRNDAKRGIASLCIGGGQGGAMLIEREGVRS
ncbi:3-ketoacyl-CoA thiolase @ Acetyl-CoA acetyltransferase [hydrothermal vent metagenome]|uniref:3-ketoacyl-CoA thiolase @ Acetyl-CoA acetyltransferase n=1 Tax=hydrothermal vent metagenome TaxID=652676 RepID=A0A3B0Z6V5_9ZZZZ